MKAIESEIWKTIIEYPEYMVSNIGRVKSCRFGKEKILKAGLNKYGYYCVILTKNKISKSKTIHQLVAIEFLNHNPCGMTLVVNHIDGIKTNNNSENLEIVTNRKNTELNSPFSTSKYVGVGWHKKTNKWRSRIRIGKLSKHLGVFDSELEASQAYQKELTKLNKI